MTSRDHDRDQENFEGAGDLEKAYRSKLTRILILNYDTSVAEDFFKKVKEFKQALNESYDDVVKQNKLPLMGELRMPRNYTMCVALMEKVFSRSLSKEIDNEAKKKLLDQAVDFLREQQEINLKILSQK